MNIFKKLIPLVLCFIPSLSIAGPYYDNSLSTTTGKTTLKVSGDVKIAASSATPTSYTVQLLGPTGEGIFTGPISGPTITALSASTSAIAAAKVNRSGDIMTGALNVTTLTVSGNAFSVGVSTLVVANGMVGIGRTPTLNLDVYESKNGPIHIDVTNNNSGNAAQAILGANATYSNTLYAIGANYSSSGQYQANATLNESNSPVAHIFSTNNTAPFEWWTNATEKMRLTSAGNVGIGTTSPEQKLHVAGQIVSSGTAYGQIYAHGTAGAQHHWLTNGNTRAALNWDDSGAKLVLNLIGPGDYHIFNGGGVGTYGFEAFYFDQSADRVGIGTAVPATTLDVQGDVSIGSGTAVSTFTNAGTMVMGGITQSVGYNPTTASTAPAHHPSIAVTAYIGVATMTVTLKGGRPALLSYSVNTNNGSGASRAYTAMITENSVMLDDEHIQTNAGTSTEMLTYQMLIPSTTAGARSFAILIKSSSATGAQTADDIHMTILEL